MDQLTGLGEWRRGWRTALAGALCTNLGTFHLLALGVLMKPLGDAFGWSRAAVSGAYTLFCVMVLLSGPPIGLLIPRFGERALAVAGVVLISLTLALIGLSSLKLR